jgi:hypothetical protein
MQEMAIDSQTSSGASQLEVTRETLLAAHTATRNSRATLSSLHDRMSSLRQLQSRTIGKIVTFSDPRLYS